MRISDWSSDVCSSDLNVLLERPITTYQTNAYGFDDTAFLDVNTLLTLAALRYSQRARIAQKFPRHKLASDGTKAGAGQAIVTPSVIRAELVALAREWEDAGWVENMDGDRKSTRLNSSH